MTTFSPASAPSRRQHREVLDVRAHGQRQVGRQGPRRRGPQQRELAGLQAHADRQGRVLALGVDVVVHPQLVVGQRGLVPPAVRQHAVALVGQALVVQLLERPDDRLHEGHVEGLVVVLEVHPTRLAGDVGLPLSGVAQHRLAARGVERGDAHLLDLRLVGQAEDPLGLELGRQAVGVPAEPTLDAMAAHRLVARHDVLDVAGQQVAVVRQPVREGRSVVEHELVRPVLAGRAGFDRGHEGAVGVPVREHVALDAGRSGEAGTGLVGRCFGYTRWSPRPVGRRLHEDDAARRTSPRYHPACRARDPTTRLRL